MSDPDFQKIFTDEEDDVFTYAISASDDTTFVYKEGSTMHDPSYLLMFEVLARNIK